MPKQLKGFSLLAGRRDKRFFIAKRLTTKGQSFT